MKPLQHLNKLHKEYMHKRAPNYPIDYIGAYKHKPTSSNGLTNCVCDFLNYSGHFAERTGNEGRVIDGRKTYTDVIGRVKTIGTVKRVTGQGTNGTSDIKAVINGKMIAIEIKYGRDSQSEAQKNYQRKIEASGGVYLIVKDFDSFYEWYINFHNKF